MYSIYILLTFEFCFIEYLQFTLHHQKITKSIQLINIRTMATEKRIQLREIMQMAWSFFKRAISVSSLCFRKSKNPMSFQF